MAANFVVLAFVFLALAVVAVVLMGIELRHHGRPTPWLTSCRQSNDQAAGPRAVLRAYRELKCEQHKLILLPAIMWLYIVLGVGCVVLALISVGRGW